MSASKLPRRAPGRPRNRGRRPSFPERQAPGPDQGDDGAEYALGRAVDREGSAHARAVAIAILGPAPPAPTDSLDAYCPLDAEPTLVAPDVESEPTAVREVVPRAEFPRIVEAGGIAAYVLRRFETGRYRCLWVASTTQTLADATFVVPEAPADRERREAALEEAAERERRVDREERAQETRVQRETADREARTVELIDAWVRAWLLRFATECARRGVSLGPDASPLLGAAEGYLRTNALQFVKVVTGGWRSVMAQGSRGAPGIPGRRWDPNLPLVRLEPRQKPAATWNALRLFLPAREDFRGRA